VIFDPCRPIPAINPLGLKTNAYTSFRSVVVVNV